MITRYLAQLTVMHDIHPAVTNVGSVEGVLVQHRGDTCRAHVRIAGGWRFFLVACLINDGVRLGERVCEGSRDIFLHILIIGVVDGLDGELAGDLAFAMTAHAV